jgi:hypothetical protein
VERFNLRKLNELQDRKQYQINIPKRCATLDKLNYNENINRAWESIKENIKPQIESSSVRTEAKYTTV